MADTHSGLVPDARPGQLVAMEIVEGLKPQQQEVLQELLSGKSIAAAAIKTGASRRAIYYWMKRDPKFLSAYHQWHEQLRNSAKSQLLMMMERAATAVGKCIDAGDGPLALRLLEKLAATGSRPDGPTDEEEALRQQKIERDKNKTRDFLL